MKRWNYVLFVFFTLIFLPSSLLAQLPQPDHIVIVIEENHGYSQIIGSSAAPYINSLVADTMSALFTDSHGVTHPSQPNYLWLFSGDNQGVIDDNLPTDTPFATPNLGEELLGSNKTFAGYSESLPYAGYTGGTYGAYARKHNPWVDWQNANPNGIPWELNKPFSDFPANYDSLPMVSFVIPNQNNDMHNGSDPATITTGDAWLQNNLNGYIQWAKTHNSLTIITFDEDDFTGANWIPTIFIGGMIIHGEYNQTINHLNVLRTIEDMYGLGYAGSSGDSTAITGCWSLTTPVELTSFSAEYNGKDISLNWITSTETNNKGFEIQKSDFSSQPAGGVSPKGGKADWRNISFVKGHGTTTQKQHYSYVDKNPAYGKYTYRLKQIDFDGTFTYSKQVKVEVTLPVKFSLGQNYPNPFNPVSIISFQLAVDSYTSLKVYDILGKEVVTLVNEYKPAGTYKVQFNGINLPSGIYFYNLIATPVGWQRGNYTEAKKMDLIK